MRGVQIASLGLLLGCIPEKEQADASAETGAASSATESVVEESPEIDEESESSPSTPETETTTPPTFDVYEDLDGDGFGSVLIVAASPSLVLPGDCDDHNPSVFPGAPEACGAVDHDCNGMVGDDDPGSTDRIAGVLDVDGDGHGPPGSRNWHCPALAPVVGPEDDCDDSDASVFPGATEICDALDQDCDGLIDEELPFVRWFVDDDEDGFGTGFEVGSGCPMPGYAYEGGDCDDADPATHPGALEACDSVDNDCDGHPDLPDQEGDLDLLGCDLCPATTEAFATTRVTINPCLLSPASTFACRDGVTDFDTHESGARLHAATWRPDLSSHREDLIVMYPPNSGHATQALTAAFASQGFQVISQTFDTLPPGSLTLCVEDDCGEQQMLELLDGTDVSADVELPYGNSIEGELSHTLTHLQLSQPTGDWERFLDPDGVVDWSRVHVMAWSSGGQGMGIVARERPVASATGLATPLSLDLDPPILGASPWTTLAPNVRIVSHYNEVGGYFDAWTVLADLTGISLSPQAVFGGNAWPFDPDAGLLVTTESIPTGCSAHNVIAEGECLTEALTQAYRHLACGLADPSWNPRN